MAQYLYANPKEPGSIPGQGSERAHGGDIPEDTSTFAGL